MKKLIIVSTGFLLTLTVLISSFQNNTHKTNLLVGFWKGKISNDLVNMPIQHFSLLIKEDGKLTYYFDNPDTALAMKKEGYYVLKGNDLVINYTINEPNDTIHHAALITFSPNKQFMEATWGYGEKVDDGGTFYLSKEE